MASAISGGYIANNLVINTQHATITDTDALGGTSQITVDQPIDQNGDTQLVLSPGTAYQEIVTFTSITGTGPYVYTLSAPLVYSHPVSDAVCRQVTINDTLASIASEAQYDPIGDPGNRATSVAGYSPGPGQWTIQFYLTATMAQVYIASIGLSETNEIGTGNLHNHLVIGYDHTSGNSDLAIDATITIINA